MDHGIHAQSLRTAARGLAVATLLSTALATAWAGTAPNLLVNGSFENGGPGVVGFGDVVSPGSTAIAGWSVANGPVIWGGPGDVGMASDGVSFVDLGGGISPQISQSVNTVTGQAYRLSFDLGTPYRQQNNPGVSVVVGAGSARSGAFHVVNNSAAQVYQRLDFDFIADRSTSDVVFEEIFDEPLAGDHIDLDNVSLTAMSTSVPEPGSWALLAAGLLCLHIVRRQPRSKAA